MTKFRLLPALLFLSLIVCSCSKEDHVLPEPTCKYLGNSYKIIYPGGRGEEYTSDFALDENGRLKDANTSYTSTFIITENSISSEYSRSTNQQDYHFIYDSNGFLMQQITTTGFIAKSKGNIGYGNGFYNDVSAITTLTTDFVYASEKVVSTSSKSVTVFIGDNQSPVETTTSSARTYQYDSDGKAQSSTEKFSNGDLSVTIYKNDIRSSNTYTSSINGAKHIVNYDETGLPSEDIIGNATYKLGYDAKGNLAYVEQIRDNVTKYRQEFKYDDHPNPETLIPTQFKGIPEPIRTAQLSDGKGANNLTEEKFTSFENYPNSSQNYTHTYNASGFPETTTLGRTIDQETISRVTTYKYQGCQ
ncbi:hypothetical protein [Dyadobacter luticola]|uniref:RHS repeat protein n=1 Tax=Dyadobacter luticola TaxID=1979387 RepID=A0A5R9KW06_9BACT|nr:hypothetical protein [Dyadobacter luticola]TLV00462.1 hypothetical protein FEN17_13320 [Dyadobacter luticola]